MNRRSLLLSAGASTLAACASTPARRREFALAGEIDAAVARAMASSGAPGLAVAVYSREGAYARGFGVTDVETGERADADTAFYIASSTKPLTALALSILHHRGELDLDATLSGYAPDAPFPGAVRPGAVRIRNMLSHTSGIENNAIAYRVAFTGQHDPETLWRLLAASELNAEAPLGRFQYTNVGYNITTVLTDRRLRVRWQDLLDREIFGPAGMRRASARMSRAQAGSWSVAKPHGVSPDGGSRRLYLEKTDQTMQSAGGVIMSANDAVRWLEVMVEDGRVGRRQIIAPEAVAATRAPLAEVGAEFEGYQRDQYGLGWYLGPYRDDRMLHHFGGFAGFRAHVSYIPARGVGVAVFINDGTLVSPLADAIANYVHDRTGGYADADQRLEAALTTMTDRRTQVLPRIAADRTNRAQRPWTLSRPRSAYAGAYENEAWGRIEVAVQGEALNVRFGVLRATAEPFTRPDSVRVEFEPGNGNVILFETEGEVPAALSFQQQRFTRV